MRTLTDRAAKFKGGLRTVAPGVFAWLQPNGAWGEANAGLIVGDGQSLLVDTLWDEQLAREMLGAIEPHVRESPIRTVLNTHSDGDHWWGNAAVPVDAEIITCESSRSAMDKESSPQELARLCRLAHLGRHVPGSVGALSRYIDDMLAPFDFSHVRLRYPDSVFGEQLTLDVGGRETHMIVLGPAHTPSDTVVHVPDANVVFAADLLFVDVIPVMWHGPSTGWLRALDVLLELDAEAYVPGHGDLATRADVELMQDFWLWLRAAAGEHTGRNVKPLAISRTIIESREFDRWRRFECPERILISVAALQLEFDGRPPMSVSPQTRAKLFRQVAILKRELEGS